MDKPSQPSEPIEVKGTQVGVKLAVTPKRRSVSCGPAGAVSWTPMLVTNPTDVVASPTKEIGGMELESSEYFEAGPSSATLLEPGPRSINLKGEDYPKQESKNVVTPRVLRPRVHPA